MPPDLDPAAVEWLRSKSTVDRFQMVGMLNAMARTLVADEVRRRWPEWNDEQVSKEVARRFLQDEDLPELYASDFRESGIFDGLASH